MDDEPAANNLSWMAHMRLLRPPAFLAVPASTPVIGGAQRASLKPEGRAKLHSAVTMLNRYPDMRVDTKLDATPHSPR